MTTPMHWLADSGYNSTVYLLRYLGYLGASVPSLVGPASGAGTTLSRDVVTSKVRVSRFLCAVRFRLGLGIRGAKRDRDWMGDMAPPYKPQYGECRFGGKGTADWTAYNAVYACTHEFILHGLNGMKLATESTRQNRSIYFGKTQSARSLTTRLAITVLCKESHASR